VRVMRCYCVTLLSQFCFLGYILSLRLCFAEISLHVLFVHSRPTEAACVLFFAWFGLIWFAVCFFGWLVSLQSLRRVSVAYCREFI
jgi:hypothetical protein